MHRVAIKPFTVNIFVIHHMAIESVIMPNLKGKVQFKQNKTKEKKTKQNMVNVVMIYFFKSLREEGDYFFVIIVFKPSFKHIQYPYLRE
jgi:hypothetical protein